jgi:integrase/predicted RNA-binding Zn-ribbon protein involved in translation (DUF1610 family)
MEASTVLKCPTCGSSEIFNNGNRYRKDGSKTQRFICRKCGLTFSENLNRVSRTISNRRISANLAKNMTSVTETKTVMVDEKDINGKLLDYHFKLKLQGYKESTIRLSYSVLNTLKNRGADLTNPETVKEVIANQSKTETAFKGKVWSGNRKRNVINAYTQFLAYLGLTWEPPSYEITRKIPFIPTEQEIDDLIAGTPNKLPAFLQLLKETAMRSGEAVRIPWKDVDFERRIIMCNQPEKGSNPRIFSELSGKLLTMLNSLPRENELVFGGKTLNSLKATFTRSRKRLAFKLGNPRLKEIHFHTLRHWKATMLYHFTKDLLYVAEFLGHKDTENTRLYVQLDKSLFQNISDDKFIIKTVSSIEEAVKLGEIGFEPFMVINGVQLMRKRK